MRAKTAHYVARGAFVCTPVAHRSPHLAAGHLRRASGQLKRFPRVLCGPREASPVALALWRTPGIHPGYTQHTPEIHSAYTRRAPGMHPTYTQGTPSGLWPGYARGPRPASRQQHVLAGPGTHISGPETARERPENGREMARSGQPIAGCVLGVCRVYAGCMPGVCPVHAGCMPGVSAGTKIGRAEHAKMSAFWAPEPHLKISVWPGPKPSWAAQPWSTLGQVRAPLGRRGHSLAGAATLGHARTAECTKRVPSLYVGKLEALGINPLAFQQFSPQHVNKTVHNSVHMNVDSYMDRVYAVIWTNKFVHI